ncbi:MAG: anti-sigma factor, partial [Salinisphaera sp.]|nr:anti-sigma factor [Salinisphaera sp.]
AGLARELEQDPGLHNEVAWWEERLGQLGLALEPVAPPAELLARILARLDAERGCGQPRVAEEPSRNTVSRRPSRAWPGLALAASLAALVLAALLYIQVTQPVQAPTPGYASIFYDQPTATGWLLTASTASGEMAVTAVGAYPLPKGKELRLWVIPAGGNPIASGIVPADGENRWPMSPRVTKLLRDPATALAVSMETAGQPVSDGPQGPILWQAKVRHRG